MKLFITGGSGFIAKSIVNYFKKDNDIELFAPDRSFLDILDETAVDTYIKQYRPDIIIHTANKGGGRNSIGSTDIVHNNLRMFFNIAKQAPKVHKIIHLGSGAEYGKHKPIINANEDDALTAFPKDDYGFYKSVCSRYIEKTDNMINLRIFGCYGEGEDYRYKFITNAIVKNLLGIPITINRNVRFDYLYIDDLIRMVEHFLFQQHRHPVYNAASGRGIDLLSLAEIINTIAESHVPITILKKGMGNEYTANSSRILQELGDKFKMTSHETAIKKLYTYFSANLDRLDTEIVRTDPYIKHCNTLWEDKNDI